MPGNSNSSHLVDPTSRYESDWRCVIKEYHYPAFIFDFKDKVVSLNGYSLKAHSASFSTAHFMRLWKVEGSNDKTTWTHIDEQQNSNSLLSNLADGNWSCRISQPFRFIRIMMTNYNSVGNYYSMFLQAIELFGTIKYL